MHLTAAEIAARAGGEVIAGAGDARATSWSFDSRTLAEGACFVALHGERDGHDFLVAALGAGAYVALVDRADAVDVPEGRAVVLVDDTLGALQRVALSVRTDLTDLRVIGVAGSTGKTSTKDLLVAALEERACHANPESYNNEFGLPITLLNTPATAEMLVTEMGERFPGDIAALCEIVLPEIGLVTNVGLAHAEHLGGPGGIEAVLAELLEALPLNGLAVLNADDPHTPALATRTRAAVVTVGANSEADFQITDVELDARLQPSFSLGGVRFAVPLHGVHQVANAAMAAVVANHGFDVSWDTVQRGLGHAQHARWRMELSESADGVLVLNDAYNANPSSMEAALRALVRLEVSGQHVAVLGDMLELGDHSAAAHEAIGRLLGELRIDMLVGVGAGGAAIADATRGKPRSVHVVSDARQARDLVRDLVRPGDAVLVKASRALGMEVVAQGLLDVPGEKDDTKTEPKRDAQADDAETDDPGIA